MCTCSLCLTIFLHVGISCLMACYICFSIVNVPSTTCICLLFILYVLLHTLIYMYRRSFMESERKLSTSPFSIPSRLLAMLFLCIFLHTTYSTFLLFIFNWFFYFISVVVLIRVHVWGLIFDVVVIRGTTVAHIYLPPTPS